MTQGLKGDQIRKFGLDLVGGVPWGTHLCQFYETKEDLIAILVPYFRAGLENNEFCMWVTAEPLNEEEAKKGMEKLMPHFSEYLKRGQIEIVSYKDWYVKDGVFDSDRVLQGWVSKLEQALKKGYSGLRLTGNTFWLEKKDWKAFTDYEEAVNDVISKYRMIAVCTYSLDKCNAHEIIDVIKNHQFALIKRRGRWELIESTEKKRIADDLLQTEESLRASEQRWVTTLASIGDAVIASDTAGKITFMNHVAEALTGWALAEVSNKPLKKVFNIVNEHTRKEVENPVAKVLEKGLIVGLANHTLLIRKDGTEIPIDDSGAPIKDDSGKISGVVLVFRGIAERRKMEAELGDLAKFPSENPNVILRLSKDGKLLYSNPASNRLLGNWLENLNVSLPEHWRKKLTEALSSGKKIEFEKQINESTFSFTVIPIVSENYVNVYAEDITERKKIEHALRESQKDLNRAQAVAKTGSWRLDTQRNVLLWSDENHRLFGIPTGTPMTYETFLSAVHPDDREYVDWKWKAGLRGEPYDIEHRIVVNGEIKWMRERAELEFNKDGLLLGGFGTTQEITELKEMQAKLEEYSKHLEELVEEKTKQLKDAERLAAIGETAGMIGHDIRNPLQAIIGEIYLSKDSLHCLPESEAKQELADSMRVIEEQAIYINKIVTDLQDYAKPLAPFIENVDFEKIVESVLPTMEIPENIEVTYLIDGNFPNLKIDGSYMKRILTNLAANAVQAMPNGGKITINAYLKDRRAFVSVEDTGKGINEEAKIKIFKPLFTTKAKGQGFGLAVVKKLAEALNCTITFESQEGKGTKFIIELPATNTNHKQ